MPLHRSTSLLPRQGRWCASGGCFGASGRRGATAFSPTPRKARGRQKCPRTLMLCTQPRHHQQQQQLRLRRRAEQQLLSADLVLAVARICRGLPPKETPHQPGAAAAVVEELLLGCGRGGQTFWGTEKQRRGSAAPAAEAPFLLRPHWCLQPQRRETLYRSSSGRFHRVREL
jgi:hypothetical protein